MYNSTLLKFGTGDIVLVSIFGAIFLAGVLYLCFVPLKNYFTALFSGAYIPSFKLISIKNRKLPVATVVNSYIMAKKSMIVKQQRPQKYKTREYNRCKLCGRPHAYIRKYGICRICFRELAHKGEIPGVKKSSW